MVFTIWPSGTAWTSNIPLRSIKKINMTLFTDFVTLAFSGGGDEVLFHTDDSLFVSGSYKLMIILSVVTMRSKKSSPLRWYHRRNSFDAAILFILTSSDNILGIHRTHTLYVSSFSFNIIELTAPHQACPISPVW